MSPEKLIHMANQIARFMESKPHDEGVAGFAGHVNDFWEPRMRRQFLEMVESGAEGFRPLVLEAAPLIRPAAA
ncbi:formate dehydrogenase subunit delta [Frigidibacter sp. ROC022]|uniref:formate dehydrogenase subunit delta n=1 Tax=Frigidibacter sp. ROC022 TaxID=2971796 RepID=UPI00215A5566|nr:formate dehydrogenase subunit delta [Frigidibacter sp. ROC022]MCR8725712.1 formate dehydrogenase subunit delta [Frigidibacter sp. ROC022]